jgi:hypothetical protein
MGIGYLSTNLPICCCCRHMRMRSAKFSQIYHNTPADHFSPFSLSFDRKLLSLQSESGDSELAIIRLFRHSP